MPHSRASPSASKSARDSRRYPSDSSSDWPGFANLYDAYAINVIPRVGKVVAHDEESYRYLVESIRQFPKPGAFKAMVAEAGFVRAAAEPMLGGLVTIHSGWKI